MNATVRTRASSCSSFSVAYLPCCPSTVRPRALPRRAAWKCAAAIRSPYETRRVVTAAASEEAGSGASVSTEAAPAETSRYTVTLKAPLGIVLEQDSKTGVIYVTEIKPESAAEKQNVKVGDQLLATSGVIYNKDLDYAGVRVKGGQEVVRMTVQGETLKTVGAAIRSHPGHMSITMEFSRGCCTLDY